MNLKIPVILASIFFIVGLFTLPHYGVNWDTINHLPRGQAYLHFFLTGKTDYSDLSKYSFDKPAGKWFWQRGDSLAINSDLTLPLRRSLYQDDATTFSWFLDHDGSGHPPLSDILSAVFNQVLFSALGVVNDIDSYRVYGIFLAAILIAVMYKWVEFSYGTFSAFIAAISLAIYPLFWSESHFNNEKDIPETVFIGILLFAIWMGVTRKSWKWLLVSGVFFGLALGTKFNVLFSPLIFMPWIVVYLIFCLKDMKQKLNITSFLKDNKKPLISAILAPLLGLVIFIASWPYLWQDVIGGLIKVIAFYRNIGITLDRNPDFLGPLGINTYPLLWIIYTTPPIILGLSLLGIIAALIRLKKEKDKTSLLFFLWLLVPVIRVSLPGATIYGGVRQVMEYIPALAVFSGLGALVLAQLLIKLRVKKLVVFILITTLFLPTVIKLISIHPNENVYFNFLIGGLKGAKEKNIPSWGNTFGAAYRQGVNWINENAEEGAKVVFTYELLPNVPRTLWRGDLDVQNSYRSGYLRNGEYAITLYYYGTENRSFYDMYLEKFIKPVYQVEVDGVAILKVWKNDQEHLKSSVAEEIEKQAVIKKTEYGLMVELPEERQLSRLLVNYKQDNCKPLLSGFVQISKDGQKWQTLPGVLPVSWRISALKEQPRDGKFIEPFVGQSAKFINLNLNPANTCLTQIEEYQLFYFK